MTITMNGFSFGTLTDGQFALLVGWSVRGGNPWILAGRQIDGSRVNVSTLQAMAKRGIGTIRKTSIGTVLDITR